MELLAARNAAHAQWVVNKTPATEAAFKAANAAYQAAKRAASAATSVAAEDMAALQARAKRAQWIREHMCSPIQIFYRWDDQCQKVREYFLSRAAAYREKEDHEEIRVAYVPRDCLTVQQLGFDAAADAAAAWDEEQSRIARAERNLGKNVFEDEM